MVKDEKRRGVTHLTLCEDVGRTQTQDSIWTLKGPSGSVPPHCTPRTPVVGLISAMIAASSPVTFRLHGIAMSGSLKEEIQ